MFSDGTSELIPFRVPDGKVLVITDINAYAPGNGPVSFDKTGLFIVNISNLAGAGSENVLFLPVTIKDEGNSSGGVGAASLSLTTGIEVSDKARVLWAASFAGGVANTTSIKMTGYLKPAP